MISPEMVRVQDILRKLDRHSKRNGYELSDRYIEILDELIDSVERLTYNEKMMVRKAMTDRSKIKGSS